MTTPNPESVRALHAKAVEDFPHAKAMFDKVFERAEAALETGDPEEWELRAEALESAVQWASQQHPPVGPVDSVVNRKPGEKAEVSVYSREDSYASFPGVYRTPDKLVLSFGVQPFRALQTWGKHPHEQPLSVSHCAVSTDQGASWEIRTECPKGGTVLDTTRTAMPLGDGRWLAAGRTEAIVRRELWGEAEYKGEITDLGPFPANHAFTVTRAPDNSLLVGSYGPMQDETNRHTCFFLRSRDEGRSWTYASQVPNPNIYSFYEPTLFTCNDGRMICMMRSGWEHVPTDQWPPEVRHHTEQTPDRMLGSGWFFVQSDSADSGKTWSEPVVTEVWGHPADLMRLRSGAILMLYGHRRPPWSIRAILSFDEGKTWDLDTIRTIKSFEPSERDFGYPLGIHLEDGTILCAYYGYITDSIELPSPHGIFASLFDEEWLRVE
ncbi:sialidase family protein [Verrucomicrobiota bacterium]